MSLPTCWYLKNIVHQKRSQAHSTQTPAYPRPTPAHPTITQREPQCKPLVHGLCCVSSIGTHLGHVDFMLFVSILLQLATQCAHTFWWNMGLRMFEFWKGSHSGLVNVYNVSPSKYLSKTFTSSSKVILPYIRKGLVM